MTLSAKARRQFGGLRVATDVERRAYDARDLSKYLESFLLARCGCNVPSWTREPRGATPWGKQRPPAPFSDVTWVTFSEAHEPLGVGIRVAGRQECPALRLLSSVLRSRGAEAAHWFFDSVTGWQHGAPVRMDT